MQYSAVSMKPKVSWKMGDNKLLQRTLAWQKEPINQVLVLLAQIPTIFAGGRSFFNMAFDWLVAVL